MAKATGHSRDPAPGPQPHDPALAELLDRAKRIKLASDDLVQQMRELASEIQEAKAKAANGRHKPRQ